MKHIQKVQEDNTIRMGVGIQEAAIILVGVLVFFPFLVMITTSFKPVDEIFEDCLRLIPVHPTFASYQEVSKHPLMLRFFLNGVIVTLSILLGQLIVMIPAAYAFAKLSFPGKKILFSLVLAALVFPRYIAAIPNFLLLSDLHLINTYPALILPFLASPFGVFLMRQYFLQLPWEYFDAARMDGCNLFQMLFWILLPLTRPAVGAFTIFSIVSHWNDFFWPLIVLQSSELFTPPAGVVFFADTEAGIRWNVIMAAAAAVILPLVILFILMKKQFMTALSHAGIKG